MDKICPILQLICCLKSITTLQKNQTSTLSTLVNTLQRISWKIWTLHASWNFRFGICAVFKIRYAFQQNESLGVAVSRICQILISPFGQSMLLTCSNKIGEEGNIMLPGMPQAGRSLECTPSTSLMIGFRTIQLYAGLN